ncbi:MAG: hydroxyacid dehydrogenase [Clostridia bacterium]|nr:hydroxyacid dehydrogenase [Clostridia bacterium]
MDATRPLELAVVGGDRRQLVAARRLRAAGFRVREAALPGFEVADPLSALAGADVVLLPPSPIGPDGVVGRGAACGEARLSFQAFLGVRPGGLVLSGALAPAVESWLRMAGLRHVDYTADPAFQAENAELTGEAAVLHLALVRGRAIAGQRIALVGYGRSGRAIARRLALWEAQVDVVARSEAARWQARRAGLAAHAMEALADVLARAEAVVTTVPALVLDGRALSRARAGTYLLDIASAPGGVDWEAARARGLPGERAGGLPGRYLSESAGRVLAEAVVRRLRERTEAGRLPRAGEGGEADAGEGRGEA